MLRSILTLAVAAALVLPASAQQQMPAGSLQKVQSLQQGYYDLDTNTFTPSNGLAIGLGPDALFDTITGCPTYYFGILGGPWFGQEWIDEAAFADRGCNVPAGTEEVNGYTWQYCNLGAAGYFDAVLRLYQDTVAFQGPSNWPVFDCGYLLVGLPDGGCWQVTVDLSGGAECVLPQTSGAGAQGTIGFSVEYVTGEIFTGPILGTSLNPACIGLGTQDLFEWFDYTGYYAGQPYYHMGTFWFGGPPKARADFVSTFWGSPVDAENHYGAEAGDTMVIQAKGDIAPGAATDINVDDPNAGTSYVMLISTGAASATTMTSSFTTWTMWINPGSLVLTAPFSGSVFTLNVPASAPPCALATAQVVSINGAANQANVDGASNGLQFNL